MSSTTKGKKSGRSAIADVVSREYTIHLHKRVCWSFLSIRTSWPIFYLFRSEPWGSFAKNWIRVRGQERRNKTFANAIRIVRRWTENLSFPFASFSRGNRTPIQQISLMKSTSMAWLLSMQFTSLLPIKKAFWTEDWFFLFFYEKVHGVSFKKRAPRAVKEIRAFATQAMVSPSPHASRSLYELTMLMMNCRARKTSASTPSWTRRSGKPVSRVSHSASVSASAASVTTRKAPRRSFTATFRPSMSRRPRVSTPLLSRMLR